MRYRENEWSAEVKYWVEHNLKNYEAKNNREVKDSEHIIDYLLSNRAPKRLAKMSVLEARNNSRKWSKALAKKGNDIIEVQDKDYIKVRDLTDDLVLVKLVSEESFKREGNMMRHCVASYYGKEDCTIYSIRDSKNQSHCTIEVLKENDEIHQIKGKGNGKIHPKYIKAVLLALDKVGLEIRESELSNLGYVNLERYCSGFTEAIKHTNPKAKFITYKGTEYLNEQSIQR